MTKAGCAIERFNDWPARLSEFIAARREMPFAWGVNDCCLFAADAIIAMTGTDFAAPFRGLYDTARGALEVVRGRGELFGVGDVTAELMCLYGIREVPPPFAQRGDLVLLEREHGESLGIISLDGTDVWAPGDEHLVCVPISEGRRAWRI